MRKSSPQAGYCAKPRTTKHIISMYKRTHFLLACSVCFAYVLVASATQAQEFCSANSSIDGVPFFVDQSYLDILNRVPDTSGQELYVSSIEGLNTSDCGSTDATLASGSCEWTNDAQMTMSLLSSSESIARNGTLDSDEAFVTALYELLLRRNPDAPGLNYFVSVLNAGGTRNDVAFLFLYSDEYRRRFACTYNGTFPPSCNGAGADDAIPSFVSQEYTDILNRPADGTGRAWWIDFTKNNQTNMCQNSSASAFSKCDRVVEAETTLNFLQSPEYQKSNPPISENGAFVTALYLHLLQRNPDQEGLQFYTNYLNQTDDRIGTIYAFLTSQEYRSRFACYAGSGEGINFGINGHPFTSLDYSDSLGVSYSTQMSLVASANLKWYRVNVAAPSSGGDYSQMDSLLTLAQSSQVQLLPVLFPVVDRERDTLDELYNESYSAAFNIVSHYEGSIHVWELSNEEDIYSMYAYGDPYNGGTWPFGPPNGDLLGDYYPRRLAISEAILHGLADGVRAADPSAIRVVNFAWLHTGFVEHLENDAIPYDIVGIHWYSNADAVDDTGMGDITCPGQDLPCPSQLLHFNVLTRIHNLTNGKPMWMTETNYVPIPGNSIPTNISWEEEYLAPILEIYLNAPASYPFQMVMIYELLDQPDLAGGPNVSQMGLYQDSLQNNGTVLLGAPKPAYQSVQQVLSAP